MAKQIKVTDEELRAAFDLVCDANDWRVPIDVYLDAAKSGAPSLAVVIRAIRHYTATEPRVTHIGGKWETTFRIQSVGYRNGPAGP